MPAAVGGVVAVDTVGVLTTAALGALTTNVSSPPPVDDAVPAGRVANCAVGITGVCRVVVDEDTLIEFAADEFCCAVDCLAV
ncbi:MAG TPA: hypothetical protein VMU34_02360 [Mycobacterium sp.]|nr:hypothetical protein [Mycobacterium sp.]